MWKSHAVLCLFLKMMCVVVLGIHIILWKGPSLQVEPRATARNYVLTVLSSWCGTPEPSGLSA